MNKHAALVFLAALLSGPALAQYQPPPEQGDQDTTTQTTPPAPTPPPVNDTETTPPPTTSNMAPQDLPPTPPPATAAPMTTAPPTTSNMAPPTTPMPATGAMTSGGVTSVILPQASSAAGSKVVVTSHPGDSISSNYHVDFAVLDQNSDGVLSHAEVNASNNADLIREFVAVDINSNGRLTREEMKGWLD